MHLIPELLELSIVARLIALGMRLDRRDLDFLTSETRVVLVSIVAVTIVIPIGALTILSILSLPDSVRIGVALVAITPVAPFVPHRRLNLTGCPELVFWLSSTSAVLATLTVPLWLGTASSSFIQDAILERAAVARLMIVLFLLPLAFGLLLRSLVPAGSARTNGVLVVVSDALLVAALMPLGREIAPDVTSLAPGLVPVFIALAAFALLVGHLGGGAREQNRRALAVLCVGRYPALPLLIAFENFADPGVLVVVLAFESIASIAAMAYVLQRRLATPARASLPSGIES